MAGRPSRGSLYGHSAAPLDAHLVLGRRFRIIRSWRRGGLDPGEVYAFLHRVADELAARQRELQAAQAENARIKGVLQHWQTWHRQCAIPDQRWPSRLESEDQR
ncbi:MAG TPA: DivIVA domain-containing protein [Micromonospora sp.]